MANSRNRKKPKASYEAKPKSWWVRHGGEIERGADAGITSGCLPGPGAAFALPLGLLF